METAANWRPTATLERLRHRAALLSQVRAFFAERDVLEVDTAQLVNFAVTDLQLHSAEVRWPTAAPGSSASKAKHHYLHTSPEYAMKRLLAAGSGNIYQMCHVFRGEEQGTLHNNEFMIVEWYRQAWEFDALMQEVDDLLRRLIGARAGNETRQISYQQSFKDALGIDPLTISDSALADRARQQGCDSALVRDCERDELLELLMGTHVGPHLGLNGPVFVHRYPATQAALARLDAHDPRVALRFELYLGGVELANGFEELTDAREQRARFAADQHARAARGLTVPAMDEYLLAALAAGLPACSGVALGFDRVLMLACGAKTSAEVMPFATDRA